MAYDFRSIFPCQRHISTKRFATAPPHRSTGHETAAQLRFPAIHRYPLRKISVIPGIFAIHSSGRAHQISRASATAASAPPNLLPSLRRNCISRIKSSRGSPSSAPTRGSCNGASAIPRRSRIGASHLAIRVQNWHSASKNSQPRACLPFPSVYSLTSEIIVSSLSYFSACLCALGATALSSSLLCALHVLCDLCVKSLPFFPKLSTLNCQLLTAFFPSKVITFPRSFTTPLSAPVGIRIISSNNPVIAVKNSSMLSSRSRVYASPCGLDLTSRTHSASTLNVGSISRRFRSSETIRKISHTSLIDSKWSRRSPSTCTTRTIRHPCSSRRLVLTFERATASVVEISSAGSGFGARNSSACTCATVRLIPHRVPISPQCKTNFCATGVSVYCVVCVLIALPPVVSFLPFSSCPLFLLLQNIQYCPPAVKVFLAHISCALIAVLMKRSFTL